MILIALLSTNPGLDTYEEASTRALTPDEQHYADADGFDDADRAVLGKCSMCHAREPFYGDLLWPPKGVVLETKSDVARHAEAIYLQAARTHAMPPPTAVQMADADRVKLRNWVRAARAVN
jgi:uncharacterized membrane protein